MRQTLGKAPRRPLGAWWRLARGAAVMLGLWGASAGGALAEIRAAEFAEPTYRYGHGVLGDTPEWGAVRIRETSGRQVLVRLPQERVFEDLEPRVVDVTGDGAPEVVVVESHQTQGARLSVYGVDGLVAATPFIGQRNRWLAPVAVADLDGDGAIELAYVDRPHLAKTLRVWRFRDGTLTEVARLPGLSNHRIGWAYIIGGLRDCGSGPEMILATGNWQDLVAIRLNGTTLRQTRLGPWTGRGQSRAALECKTP